MTLDTVVIVVTLLTQTAAVVWWGARLTFRIERHDESLYGERGLHVWRHDVVTPRLYALDELLEQQKEKGV